MLKAEALNGSNIKKHSNEFYIYNNNKMTRLFGLAIVVGYAWSIIQLFMLGEWYNIASAICLILFFIGFYNYYQEH